MEKRLEEFLENPKLWDFLALAFYIIYITSFIEILPPEFKLACYCIQIFATLLLSLFAITSFVEKTEGKISKLLLREIKKIAKEILCFIPIMILANIVINHIIVGTPENQSTLIEQFNKYPTIIAIEAIIVAPIMEEIVHRILPKRFIKNKVWYIIISTGVFAAMHVINDPRPLYYVWCYVPNAVYYAYRYQKTQDPCVPIALHSVNNLIATLQIFQQM